MSNDQGEFPFADAAPELVPLLADELTRLQCAGAGANEIEAVMRAPDADARAWLIDFFSILAADGFRLLRVAVALVAWFKERGKPATAGADIIANCCRGIFDVSCDNDVRCLLPRAVWIVRPDLRYSLNMEDGADADLLLRIGWMPSLSCDWQSITAPSPQEIEAGEFQ